MTTVDLDQFCLCDVGTDDDLKPRLVRMSVLADAIETLSDQAHQQGLEGDALDQAVNNVLPRYLFALLGEKSLVH